MILNESEMRRGDGRGFGLHFQSHEDRGAL